MQMSKNRPIPHNVNQEHGSALIFSLVLLTAITLGAMVAMQRSSLQLKMVSSMQHDQQVFNATYSEISNGFYLMNQNLGVTKTLLSRLINDESLTIDPYTSSGWNKPNKPATIGSVDGQLSISSLGSGGGQKNANSLKANAGNASNTEVTYYFTYTVTGTDISGRITSAQELGVSYTAPAAN